MSIASELTALNTDIVNARAAITTMGGTVTSGGGSSQLAADIATIPSGGFDMSVTDNQLKMLVEIPEFDKSINISFLQSVAYGCTIDWGDGTDETSSSKVGGDVYTATVYGHSYSTSGAKIITITANSGTITVFGNYAPGSRLIASPYGVANDANLGKLANAYHNMLKQLEVGDNIILGYEALTNFPTIMVNRLPNTDGVIAGCGNTGFLGEIVIPEGVTTVGGYCFSGSSFRSVKLPSTLTSIGQYAFNGCQGCAIYDFTAIALSGSDFPITIFSNSFNGIHSKQKIVFATKEVADAAKAATNWASLANYITYIGEENV